MKKAILIIVLIIVVAIVVVVVTQKSGTDTASTTDAAEVQDAGSTQDTSGEVPDSTITNTNQSDTSMSSSNNAVPLNILDSGSFPYYFAKVYVGTGFGFNVTLNGTSLMKLDSSNSRRRSNISPEQAQTLLKSGPNEIGIEITDVVDSSNSYYKPSLGVYIVGNDQNSLPDMFPSNPNDPQPHIITQIKLAETDIKPGKATYVFNLKK